MTIPVRVFLLTEQMHQLVSGDHIPRSQYRAWAARVLQETWKENWNLDKYDWHVCLSLGSLICRDLKTSVKQHTAEQNHCFSTSTSQQFCCMQIIFGEERIPLSIKWLPLILYFGSKINNLTAEAMSFILRQSVYVVEEKHKCKSSLLEEKAALNFIFWWTQK